MLFLVFFLLAFPLLVCYLFFYSIFDSLHYIDGVFESLYWWQLYTKAVRWTDANYVQFYYRAMYLTESYKKAFRHYFFDQNRFTQLYHRFHQMRRHRDYTHIYLFYAIPNRSRSGAYRVVHKPRNSSKLSFFWSEDVWSYVVAVKHKIFMPFSFFSLDHAPYYSRSKKNRRYFFSFKRLFSVNRFGRPHSNFFFPNILTRFFGNSKFNSLKLRFLRRNFRFKRKPKIVRWKKIKKLARYFRRFKWGIFHYTPRTNFNLKPLLFMGRKTRYVFTQRSRSVTRTMFMSRIKDDIAVKTKYFKLKLLLKPKEIRKYSRASTIFHWSHVRPFDFLRNRFIFRKLDDLRTTFNFRTEYENHLRAPAARRYKRFKAPFYTNSRKNFFFRNFGKTFHTFYYDSWPKENEKIRFKYEKNAYVSKLERLYNRYISKRFEVSRRPFFYRYSTSYPLYMHRMINGYFKSYRRARRVTGFRHKGRIFP
jgi:hypothetical protein